MTAAALTLTLAALLGGCGQGGAAAPSPSAEAAPAATPAAASPEPSPEATGRTDRSSFLDRARSTRPQQRALDAEAGYAVTASVGEVVVLDAPDGEETHRLANPNATGAPLTFLLAADGATQDADGWYEVHLPVRPNGSTGWVDADDVDVARVPYRLAMDVDANELSLYEGDELLRTMPAASGTGNTPTPTGLFYLTELLVPTNRGYGPYAYGLSGFSEVLTSFGGGPGQIGLHGTDDAASVGRAVSNGCIRLSDEDITFLAETLPLGTPVQVG